MIETEIAIVGAGPAGLAAACASAQFGSKVVVFDENNQPGGQLVKQTHKFFGSKEHLAGIRGVDIGEKLYNRALSLGVDVRLGTAVWGYFENQLAIVSNNQAKLVCSKKIIVATGASENVLSFPGWTLPGVMGAGGAQTLMNLHRVLPGKKILMVGAGNVGLIVSYQMLQAGVEVVAVVEAASKIGGYKVHADKILRNGVPILTSHTVKEALGRKQVEKVIIAQVGSDFSIIPKTERELDVDTICLAVGLTPLTELMWLIGCEMKYYADLGGFIPVHDQNMETSVLGIYVAGDAAGIEEASIAMEEGRIAGIAAAESLGYILSDKAAIIKDKAEESLLQLRMNPTFAPSRPQESNEKDFLNKSGAIPIIDCNECIPCNPCETTCPYGCIQVGNTITNLPSLNLEKCTGCGQCVLACPGLAIFLLERDFSEDQAAITVPYEFLPLPEKGENVIALDRNGSEICEGEIINVRLTKKADRTALVKVAVPKEYADMVRSIKVNKLDADKEKKEN
ncbi:MAG: hypothetical protein A2Z35_04070 [Actinobacteria bacterium RBG_19FT_COMBO_36_27]|nr:MAG: hypothetical protein A2Z35_04070 [Actinobacteria bacterium RBG_19FT_COMBO_36_27]